MRVEDYKFIDINGVSIAYTDHGVGRTMLLVHGFASFSYTWLKLQRHLPEEFRFISIDLKGHGYSEKKHDSRLAPVDQAVILSGLIKALDLRDVILVGHGMGGAVSLISLFSEDVRERVGKLVVLDSTGVIQTLPVFIADLTSAAPSGYLVKYTNEELMAWLVLKQAFHDETRIDDEMVQEYGGVLRQEFAKECIVACARQISDFRLRAFHENIKDIDIPSLIIWGENDTIVELPEAYRFQSVLKNAQLEVIPDCGHTPQEEKPLLTARKLAAFLGVEARELPPVVEAEVEAEPAGATQEEGTISRSVNQFKQASSEYIRKLRMSRLVDRWTLGTAIIFCFIKILQVLKKIGFKAEENGWRKATGIFLRREHSKFILASFRLNYLREKREVNLAEAKTLLVTRLADFLRLNPACHWTLDWSRRAILQRRKIFFTDIIEAEFDNDGVLVKLVPHLDQSRESFYGLNEEILQHAVEQTVKVYNENRLVEDHKRAWVIDKKLKRWTRKYKLSFAGKQELRLLLDRILNATIIQFEVLDDSSKSFLRSRLATPNLSKKKHPGSGLMNIVCRFTPDYQEADLWFQHHHVPVDGMPMQEMLEKLKAEWGEVGSILYPALGSKDAKPEIFYLGDRIFRARMYVDFDKVINVRRKVNEKYYAEMGGPASIASIIIWGMAHSKFFADKKYLFPVDTASIVDFEADRNISLLTIRPQRFFDERNPMEGFLKFQREFNHRLLATRMGKSESHEMLELYSIAHPLFYYIAKYFMPKALGEILGSVGVTIIKNAEMFVSPLTEIQLNGFMAIGNLKMQTEDGKTLGAVSICGSRAHIKEYIKAVDFLTANCDKLLGIKL
jgi:pimeloyl-ACP methyl ester carboxylesterase